MPYPLDQSSKSLSFQAVKLSLWAPSGLNREPDDYAYHYSFHYQEFGPVCGLDYLLTLPFGLGSPCLVSTPSLCRAWLGIDMGI